MQPDQPPRPRPARSLPSALDAIDEMLARAGGRRLAVFLDYDGTLTPIVERPELAVLPETMREAVRRLGDRALVAIVSGRDLDDVRALVGIEGIAYAGSHGFQLRDADGRVSVIAEGERFRADLEGAAEPLEDALAGFDGAIVERKGFAVAAHYRQVPEGDHDAVRARVEAVARAFPALRVTGGKMVIELRPALDWDKGRAVEMLVERAGGDSVFPIYLGDDETDEDAFRALHGRGAGIVVGAPSATMATYCLESVAEVESWLRAITGRLEVGG